MDAFVPAWNCAVNVPCNTADEILFRNARINSERDLPWLDSQTAHNAPVVICGGGPSLKECLPEIRERMRLGQHIFALNGAAEFLVANGVKPLCFLTIDARPENVRFVKSRPAAGYLLASTCDPALFDELADAQVVLFHQDIDGIMEHISQKRAGCLISSSLTSGLAAMTVAYTLGYREMHLYGYDSSDGEVGSHAYPQDETIQEQHRLSVRIGDRTFLSQPTMYAQAMAFRSFAEALDEAGCVIQVHGDGLLPAYVREWTKPADASRAVYDLGSAPASFDFFAWLIIAEMARRKEGCIEPLRVAFNPGPADGFRNDYGREFVADRQQMLDKVMRPALALIGAVEDPSACGQGSLWHNRYTFEPVVAGCRRGDAVPRFKAPPQASEFIDRWLRRLGVCDPVVVTLRESKHWPHRNSRVLNWLRFAESIDQRVIFVRDTDKARENFYGHMTCPEASEDILIRMALYERAKCNLFVANGPAALAFFSERPYLMFSPLDPTGQWMPGTDAWWRKHHGIGYDEQFPWSQADQRLVWTGDSYPSIKAAWDEFVQSQLRG